MSTGAETLNQAFGLPTTTNLGVPDSQPREERKRDFQDPLRREIARLQVPVEVGCEFRIVYDDPRSEKIDGMKRGYEFSLIYTLCEYTPNEKERRRGKQPKVKTFREPFLFVPYRTSIDHQKALATALGTTQDRVVEKVAELRKTFGYLEDKQGNSQVTVSTKHTLLNLKHKSRLT